MTTDVERFKQTFITECYELLQDMEEKLLGLEHASAELDEINAIFRCAHSIKGGAGVFGFTQITSFTHILEALLDKMREGEVEVSTEAVGQLLIAKDIVLRMVDAAKAGESMPADFGSETAKLLQEIAGGSLASPDNNKDSNKESAKLEESSASAQNQPQEACYVVKFVPHKNLFATGNDPLLILRALRKLGKAEVKVNTGKVPEIADYQPRECYLSWEVKLQTEHDKDAIHEVFEFVEDVCDLEISEQFLPSNAATQEEMESQAINPEIAPQVKSVQAQSNSDSNAPSQNNSNVTTLKTPAAPSAPPAAAAGGASGGASGSGASIRVDIEKVDRLVNMVGEIVITQTMLAAQSKYLPVDQYTELLRGIDELAQHTRELQEAVMMMRMQPVKSIFSRMPRLVRDVSAKLAKNIKLEMSGEATEVDKTVVEQLADPLTHMIRNAMDHGIELPATRVESGKPEYGTINLEASHRGGRIVIEISDDGAGINRQKVLEKAKAKGLVAESQTLSDEEIDMLIFAPGFSTADQVSDISGRGVGMDVVRRNIEGIGGIVSIHNRPGKGSTFSVSLPLTLAILDAMIVRVGREFYIVPINNIIETMRPKDGEVRHIANGSDVINVRGEFIHLIYLHQLFGISNAVNDPSKALVVLVECGQGTSGLVVDELIGQQQVVIKSLEENLDPVAGVSGATILGDGSVALILDIAALGKQKADARTINSNKKAS
jgi:two-component system chemotaxis sensor kinase CheA